ncbi:MULTISPECIES: 3-hydroxyacyl-ACP dehydratase FabZ [unclassified Hydrogenobaculum]|jgi:beta-hydroxyacyl-[acyl carrier protein] dehydratase FabZ|uniref:3-hydroxyacyl-ACP dehydratase FabZ n=1 Tax=unclassified Hydrogenobaculum TaxID=2622382 RepID=UPI0001C50379|nr:MULTISPECIES: 3-hydroxyacyl-ACP dehydratase FabZ [unclassified Hydrogenobaculum]AEF19312.1 beta-hydroxyacyl-(acyl-carrier-protein) dehydratase FabZ [Hydrogenobaculum sp. 3684]AEG46601.1 (3R)-hydroxymyristoyl-(acyl-carrier-protein) dehydratase [Hydrogenobaculum sp. SHO]AGG15246.1 3-hydroxyacyl-(acyl-carrier-protein) dehydratase [Hydrogenobaculum sp. HO]AGH93544.1 beta-hydroxyacyl-(acyl carrier protein) dehydratase FabZ [Hydrogenobaculum sp. SN]
MDVLEIMKIIPHRYPLLLVDKILEIELGKRIVGLKNVSMNEPFFQGHFPGYPLMPGVYMLEAMAQVGGILMIKSLGLEIGKYAVVFAGIDEARFKRPVYPGDQLIMELETISLKKTISKMKGVAKVNNQVVAEAILMAAARELESIKK